MSRTSTRRWLRSKGQFAQADDDTARRGRATSRRDGERVTAGDARCEKPDPQLFAFTRGHHFRTLAELADPVDVAFAG
jgi:hypothetical protein